MKQFKRRRDLWISIAEETYKAQQFKKKYAEIEKDLLTKLKEKSEHHSSIGGEFKFELTESKGTIKYKDIEILKTIDLEQYRGSSIDRWKLSKF